MTVTARADEAAVRDGANDIVRTADGVAMAVWTPDGTLDKSVVLLPSNGFRLPAERKFLAMSRLRRASETELVTPK